MQGNYLYVTQIHYLDDLLQLNVDDLSKLAFANTIPRISTSYIRWWLRHHQLSIFSRKNFWNYKIYWYYQIVISELST